MRIEPEPLKDRARLGLQEFCNGKNLTVETLIDQMLVWESTDYSGFYFFIWDDGFYRVEGWSGQPYKADPTQYPVLADVRSYRFFPKLSQSNSKIRKWDTTHVALTATRTVRVSGKDLCVYCAGPAYIIQGDLAGRNRGSLDDSWRFEITGHTCICKGACDERDAIVQIKVAEENLRQAKTKLPRINLSALRDVRVKHLAASDSLSLDEIVDRPFEPFRKKVIAYIDEE